MIEIRDLRFQYGDEGFALDIPELQIASASQVAVVGPSGSGKTTFLHLLAGIMPVVQGRLRVGDIELSGKSDRARRDFRITQIGQVFQDFELLEYLDVRDNILLPYRINRRLQLDREVQRAAGELAASVGIGDLLQRPIGRLSQGERQRVAICRALLPRPSWLLADEPTGNLDPANKRRIIDLLCERARQSHATLIVVTHDHSLLDRFERVIDFRSFQTAPEG